MGETLLYPPWKGLVKYVADRVGEEGYGWIIDHEELDRLLMIEFPETGTKETYTQIYIEKLKAMESAKDELLDEHRIYLFSRRGVGYEVLEPDDQVDKGTRRHIQKALKQVHKAKKALKHVEAHLLSDQGAMLRSRSMVKLAYIHHAFTSRSPVEIDDDKKALPSG